jgi:hypothetical protein
MKNGLIFVDAFFNYAFNFRWLSFNHPHLLVYNEKHLDNGTACSVPIYIYCQPVVPVIAFHNKIE